jgi:hypothetical protein
VENATAMENGSMVSTDSTPLYTSLTDYIENILTKTKDLSDNMSKKRDNRDRGSSTNISPTTPMSKPSGSAPRGTERAAAAAVTTHSPPGPRQIEPKPAEVKYDHEITREHNIFVVDDKTGRKNLYTATKAECPKCATKDPSKKCPAPSCYVRQCRRCKLYGHRDNECKQKISEEGRIAEAA